MDSVAGADFGTGVDFGLTSFFSGSVAGFGDEVGVGVDVLKDGLTRRALVIFAEDSDFDLSEVSVLEAWFFFLRRSLPFDSKGTETSIFFDDSRLFQE